MRVVSDVDMMSSVNEVQAWIWILVCRLNCSFYLRVKPVTDLLSRHHES
jgi:hypothetical protein